MIEVKNELIEWIKNLDDLERLQKLIDIKNCHALASLVSDIKSETIVKTYFDEQFAAGMTSDELMENIAAHIEL
ncbi:hypothetical protein [Kaistella sp.]|uniref:hypothetical protein n=1 Tax=Kaistella sp. TaxID=2782235 RepID=UPI003C474BC4